MTQQVEANRVGQVMIWQRQQQRTEHMEDMLQDAHEFICRDPSLDEDAGSDAMYAEARKRIQTDITEALEGEGSVMACLVAAT